ncbi:MAG: hypothetical protein ACYCZ0_02720 [Minisyncoccota bacterium]
MNAVQAKEAENRLARRRVLRGVAHHFNAKRPWWRHVASHCPLVMADPHKCMLAVVETAYRSGMFQDVDRLRALIIRHEGLTFAGALLSADMSYEIAIAYGLARDTNDPVTMYGTLQSYWVTHLDPHRY